MKDFGNLYAVDALGRRLPTSVQVGPERADRSVGVFYFLVHGAGARPTPAPVNVTNLMRETPEATRDFNHPAWGSGALYWGEPLFGYYFTDDKWVIRRHVKLLTMAGADFLIFDTTNRHTYFPQVRAIMEVLEEYRLEGWNVPKIAYYTNTRSGETVHEIYNDVYKPGLFPELWFKWEGKPFIVAMPDELTDEEREFFTVRVSQWPTEKKKELGCPWIDFERPQRVWGEREIVPVSVAQHPNISFGDAAFYGEPSTRGRNYHGAANDKTPEAILYGYNVAEQWERAMEVDPRMVFFTGWNEWCVGKIKGDEPRPVLLIDQADIEYSRDTEPMRGGFFDNYYMQLCQCIRSYKGAPELPPPGAASEGEIDWDEVYKYWAMPFGTIPRDFEGAGGARYKDDTGRNEFDYVQVAHDSKNIYFRAKTRGPIEFNMFTKWMTLFIGVEGREYAPDWHGYHYLINDIVLNESVTFLQTCLGGFRWGKNTRVSFKKEQDSIVITLPRKELGLTEGPFSLHFKWADHTGKRETIEDFYEHGDCAPYGRFDYLYRAE